MTVERAGGETVTCRYAVSGRMDRLRIPHPAANPARMDGLWRHTCFELFARSPSGTSYTELNLSPSGDWAAYGFDGYRQGMRDLPFPPPVVVREQQPDRLALTATFKGLGPGPMQLAIAAVLEDLEGVVCYWALQHPAGKPDFHHDAGFMARI